MDDAEQSQSSDEVSPPGATSDPQLRGKLIRWAIILCVGFGDRLSSDSRGITVAVVAIAGNFRGHDCGLHPPAYSRRRDGAARYLRASRSPAPCPFATRSAVTQIQ